MAGGLTYGIARRLSNKCLFQKTFFTMPLYTSSYLSVQGIQIKMPSLSPTMEEGTIVKWFKKEGDPIKPGDLLCDIQTDKTVVSYEIEEEGILAKILVPKDAKDIKIGTLIALIVEEEEDWKSVEIPEESSVPVSLAEEKANVHSQDAESHSKFGPAVRLLLEKHRLSPSQISPSGRGGVITKEDVMKTISGRSAQENTKVASPIEALPVGKAEKSEALPAPPAQPAPPAEKLNYRDIELTTIRKTIAKRLSQSKFTIPHSYFTVECTVDNLNKLRRHYRAERISLSMNDLIIKAVATALTRCPELNAVYENDQYTQLPDVDISMAVATKNGLITPIVKNANNLGLEEISRTARDLAAKAKEGRLRLDEFQGGSFTISNLGMFGIREFNSIINLPQVGILAVGAGVLLFDEEEKPCTRVCTTLSYNSEVIGEETAVRFLNTIKEIIENPYSMLIGGFDSKKFNMDQIAL